jgi:hypothetical protein
MPSDFRQARTAVNAAVDAVTALLAGGALRIYTDPRPAMADAAPPASAVRLVELAFGDPAFAAARDGVAAAHALDPARAIANGSPAWCRAVTADGRTVFDGSVGLESSRADLELSVATIIVGAEVVITSMTYRAPKGA